MTIMRMGRSKSRPLPSFLIIGTAKGGTTSLHEYLCQHPRVNPPVIKEIHYFDHAYHRGERWYRAHFPRAKSKSEITGESTPYYLFHPRVPERAAHHIPNGRFIAVLRNPIDRAISHHNHELTDGFETLQLGDALDREAERLAGEEERILGDPRYRSFSHQHHSYVARGRYAEQLERWFGHFGQEQFLVLSADDLFSEPLATVERAQAFLELDPVPPLDVTVRNARSYPSAADGIRGRLQATFAPDNQRLYELIGRDFGWK